MQTLAIPADKKPASLLLPLTLSLLATLFLFYIDEGHYSLRGITHTGNLIVLSFYLTGFFAGLLIAQKLCFRNMTGLAGIVLRSAVGLITGFFLGMGIVFLVGGFFRLLTYLS